jgi:hypothetical protein
VIVHEVTGNQGLTKGCRHRRKRLDKNIPMQSSGDKFRRLKAAFDEIVEERPPGGFALPAHVLDSQKNLLAG